MGFTGNKALSNVHTSSKKQSILLSIELWSCAICRCGFAQRREEYDSAVKELFSTLDIVEHHLGESRYLCGNDLTLADVCLFTTLVRFDLVYDVLFKCTKKKLIQYPNLTWLYARYLSDTEGSKM